MVWYLGQQRLLDQRNKRPKLQSGPILHCIFFLFARKPNKLHVVPQVRPNIRHLGPWLLYFCRFGLFTDMHSTSRRLLIASTEGMVFWFKFPPRACYSCQSKAWVSSEESCFAQDEAAGKKRSCGPFGWGAELEDSNERWPSAQQCFSSYRRKQPKE